MPLFASPSNFAHGSEPAPILSEMICLGCLHHAFEDEPSSCAAVVNDANQTIVQCERCKTARKTCVPVPTTAGVVREVNELLALRLAHSAAVQDTDEGEKIVPSHLELVDKTLRVRSFVVAQVRMMNFLGSTKRPSMREALVDIAKSLQGILHVLTNLLDVTRHMAGLPPAVKEPEEEWEDSSSASKEFGDVDEESDGGSNGGDDEMA